MREGWRTVSGILDRFEDLRRAEPGRLLIHLPGPGTSRSAADIWSDHLVFAERLHAWGIQPHQLIVSGAGNDPAGVPLFLACRALDVTLLAVDPGTTLREVIELGDRFQAAALALPMTSASPARHGASCTRVAGLTLVLREERVPRTYPRAALLKLSSGSTGAPKTALVTDAQLVGDGSQVIGGMAIGPDDTQIAAIPLSHSYGLGVLMMPMLLQGTPIVLRETFVPHQLPADARRFDARRFPGVPFMFQYFLDHASDGGWPPRLQRLVSAGARLPVETIHQFHDRYGVKIHNFYGTTETGGIAFDDDPELAKGGIGRPLPGVTISLKEDADLPAGTGRIHVRSAAVADGYLDGADEGEGFETGGFLTGDFGTVDAAGRLTLAGRVSSFINIAGRKVQPDEVEAVLRSIPHVRDARVLGAPDARRGQQIVACVVADTPMSLLEVRQFCAARLAPHKIPRVVLFLDSIPLTARGKTDGAALEVLLRAELAGRGSLL